MSKILLVEDDNNLREIYEARLQAEGYVIVSAKDGEEALVVAKAEKPDLIVSDVMMPKISGFEMLDILRNTPELKDTKVVMLTALGQTEDQSRASHLGADRYLVKSQVTLEDIVKTAHELLEDEAPEADTPLNPAESADNAAPPLTQDIPVNPAPAVEQPAPAPVIEQPLEPEPAPIEQPEPSSVAEKIEPEPPETAPASVPTSEDIAIDANGQIESGNLGSTESSFGMEESPAVQAPNESPLVQAPSDSESSMNAAQAANVETLTQAVNDLASETPPEASAPLAATALPSEAPEVIPTSSSSSDMVSGKKVIQPLNQPQEKSLDELLALETASEPKPPEAPPQEPVVMDGSKPPFDPSDPNNIAL